MFFYLHEFFLSIYLYIFFCFFFRFSKKISKIHNPFYLRILLLLNLHSSGLFWLNFKKRVKKLMCRGISDIPRAKFGAMTPDDWLMDVEPFVPEACLISFFPLHSRQHQRKLTDGVVNFFPEIFQDVMVRVKGCKLDCLDSCVA